MKRFSALITALDQDASTTYKVEVLAQYFREAPAEDAVWALYLLTGRKLKRLIQRKQLFELIQTTAAIPTWLFDECYAVVGDLAETCALLWPDNLKTEQNIQPQSLQIWMQERCALLPSLPPEEVNAQLIAWWQGLPRPELFLAIKLLTGGFRSGVAQGLVVKALAKAYSQEATHLLEGLSGDWPVTGDWFKALVTSPQEAAQFLAPLPFYLASPLTDAPQSLGNINDFCLEWKWDGIRAQIIKHGERIAIWSRGEELISDRFPELVEAAQSLTTDFVLDGEILACAGDVIRPFSDLQLRIGRKKITAKLLQEIPVKFYGFDCLRLGTNDLRAEALKKRREQLESLLRDQQVLQPSPSLICNDWEEAQSLRASAKSRGVEGLMLKRWDAPYRMGRKRGDFWKWKIEPMTLDAVLIYAQAGHGRRATLYTDYTFALWQGEQLVPFAKAYSGLDDAAIRELDTWIRKHTKERFGPVRSVEPLRVFEIAFEGISRSPRHKSGIAVRFPRILRERTDKAPGDADTVERALGLISER